MRRVEEVKRRPSAGKRGTICGQIRARRCIVRGARSTKNSTNRERAGSCPRGTDRAAAVQKGEGGTTRAQSRLRQLVPLYSTSLALSAQKDLGNQICRRPARARIVCERGVARHGNHIARSRKAPRQSFSPSLSPRVDEGVKQIGKDVPGSPEYDTRGTRNSWGRKTKNSVE